jgi:site-specific recombinase XerD
MPNRNTANGSSRLAIQRPVRMPSELAFLFVSRTRLLSRRDTAIIMLLLDTGARRNELLSLRVGDVSFEYDVIQVLGKGGRQRAVPFGHKTASSVWSA